MFKSVLQELERHIELNEGTHRRLVRQLLHELCHNNPIFWQEATDVVVASLKMRMSLWDEAVNPMESCVTAHA